MQKLVCNKTFDKKEITKLIEWFTYNYGSIRTTNLLNKLKYIGFKYSTKAGLSLGPEDLKTPIIKHNLITNTIKLIEKKQKMYKVGNITKQNLLQKEIETWSITNNTLKSEIIKNFRQNDLLNPVYMMIFSGARGNLTQIKQLIGMRGLMSDSTGEIINLPIKSSLKEGLKSKEYFISCYGARKGIIDTALKTANSGYLTRKLIYAAQNTVIKQQNCQTQNGMIIKLILKDKGNYLRLKNKIIGAVLLENIINKENKKTICKGQDICPYIAKKIIQTETYIYIRSILTCSSNIGLCQLCYGWNLSNNKLVKIGEAVGILAAQSIGEPGTQLTMRTFHTGGVFTSKINKVINSPHKGKIVYNDSEGGKKIKDKFGEDVFFTTKQKTIYIKKNKEAISKLSLPRHSMIFLKPKRIVFKKQVIAEIPEWKKIQKNKHEMKEIKNHNSGQIRFQIKSNLEKLWIISGNILDSKEIFNKILKYNKEMKDIKKNKEIYFINQNKTKNLALIKELTRINFKSSKLFRNTTKKRINKEIHSIMKIVKEQKKIMTSKINNQRKVNSKIKKIGEFSEKLSGVILQKKGSTIITLSSTPYLIPRYSNIRVKNEELIGKNTTIFKSQYKKEKTKDIIEGLPKIEEILEAKKSKTNNKNSADLHEKLSTLFDIYSKKYNNKVSNRKTIQKIRKMLVNQVEKVYTSQGVNIAEKHIEVIIKQITSKIIIRQKGDSNMIEGELFDINRIEKINMILKNKVIYEPILIGISKTSLLNEGFISAACFQETVRILSKSAIKGKIDWLTGLKENIIIGNLIPTGTNNARIESGV